ncbi:MAG TPA: hypothetical protein VGN23_00900 [Verrucomicrobiae bacterium]|jgi:hypothetical protein
MLNLEKSVTEWRQQMLAAGIELTALDELEGHVREDIERQMKMGINGRDAFRIAVQQIGEATGIKTEFGKIDTNHVSHSLAWIAWGSFVISFFLPACNATWGWQCAGLSATAISWSVSLASMTLANVFMVGSVFLVLRYSQKDRVMKWVRFSSLAALILVWSYVFSLIATGGGPSLKIGCYIWCLSFLLLFLAVFKIPGRKRLATKYV